MFNFKAGEKDFNLISVDDCILTYSNAKSLYDYVGRRDSFENIYTIEIYLKGVYEKVPYVAIIKVNSCHHATEQEIKTLYFSSTSTIDEIFTEISKNLDKTYGEW